MYLIMDKFPRIITNLKKIKHNAAVITSLAKKYNIAVNAITKSTCGNPKIAKAIIEGGANILGDSRIENLKHFKDAKLEGPLMLIRSPMLSEIKDVIEYSDISLNSEITVIEALSKQAKLANKTHQIILMIEMGDLREGVKEDEINTYIDKILKLNNIELLGFGMNLTCYGAVIPDQEKITTFENIVKKTEKEKNISIKMLSGGNSSTIHLLLDGLKNERITDLRLGESIMLGRETAYGKHIEKTYDDAFILEAEIIELKIKGSIPKGKIGVDAFGKKPVFKDQGNILRGLIAIGKQDTNDDDLIPIDPNIEILGISSDHLIVHVKDKNYKVGDKVKFKVKYGALLKAFTSPYVKKLFI